MSLSSRLENAAKEQGRIATAKLADWPTSYDARAAALRDLLEEAAKALRLFESGMIVGGPLVDLRRDV